ncbi:protein RD3-like [Pygocentrus nattereri]|uniref:protein RD3-like n=1 Tax=Pygocentrus nattereri TaxID=42514 RepID=UPI0008148878|nr:protein RD3-like [Pygocentrus nattereri]
MESRYHGHHPLTSTSLPTPFMAWMKWPYVEGEQGPSCVAPGGPGRVLLQELLWQLEHRERQALEEELQHRFSHSSSLAYRRPLARPSLLALMPSSECRQLERLCARIPPSHTATVLSRFRDILAHNDVLPWELVCVFKQVLKDFLRRQDEYRRPFPLPPPTLLPVSPPHAESNGSTRQSRKSPSATPSPEGQERHREEIPTISSYVDRHLRSACPYAVQRDCLPYCQSLPYDCPEAYSTTL